MLVITYYWPPSGGGGVQRWLKFVKYFRDFGWEPIVFTPANPEMPAMDESLLTEVPEGIETIKNTIWEPYSFYKKLTGKKTDEKIQTAFLSEKERKRGSLEKLSIWIRGNLFIPDARRFWINPSIKQLENYLKTNKVDAIVSTGPPHSTHLIGLGLKEKTDIPWLADFRDPWTNIDYYQDLKPGKRADKKQHQLEEKVLKSADAVTVISPGMEREFTAIVIRKYSVIPNGFDNADMPPLEDSKVKVNKFSLAHIGSLTKTRNPENLWEALKQLVDEDKCFATDLEIRNIGKMDYNATASLQKYGLKPFLKRTDYLAHKEVVIEQRKAALLLLLINNTPNAKLILTGKIFEYLVSGRPVVCIGPLDGDAAAVIRESECGSVYDFLEVNQLKKGIKLYYERFKKNQLFSDCKNVAQFDRRNLSGKMAEALESMLTMKQKECQ